MGIKRREGLSRRGFLALVGTVTVQTVRRGPQAIGGGGARMIEGEGAAPSVQADFLSATLSWNDPATGTAPTGVVVRVSRHRDLSHPLVQVTLPNDATSYRFG